MEQPNLREAGSVRATRTFRERFGLWEGIESGGWEGSDRVALVVTVFCPDTFTILTRASFRPSHMRRWRKQLEKVGSRISRETVITEIGLSDEPKG
jgi:hypothetical protein